MNGQEFLGKQLDIKADYCLSKMKSDIDGKLRATWEDITGRNGHRVYFAEMLKDIGDILKSARVANVPEGLQERFYLLALREEGK